MSTFIVDDKTINGVASYLFRDRDNGHILRQLGEHTTPAKLGEAMYRLNLAAVEDRYGEYAAGTMCDLDYKFRSVIVTKIQVIKSLSCWLYQCSEGTIHQDPLFKVMEKYRGELAMDIVQAMPEWETATWA